MTQTTAPTALTVTRELRGTSAYWIHVEGPASLLGRASRAAGVAAGKWAKEISGDGPRFRAIRISSGGQYGPDTFRHSVCYSIG